MALRNRWERVHRQRRMWQNCRRRDQCRNCHRFAFAFQSGPVHEIKILLQPAQRDIAACGHPSPLISYHVDDVMEGAHDCGRSNLQAPSPTLLHDFATEEVSASPKPTVIPAPAGSYFLAHEDHACKAGWGSSMRLRAIGGSNTCSLAIEVHLDERIRYLQ